MGCWSCGGGLSGLLELWGWIEWVVGVVGVD